MRATLALDHINPMEAPRLIMDETSAEERLKLWMPQARALAARARSADEVKVFFRRKGVPEGWAAEAAAELWEEAARRGWWWRQPKCWLGGSLLASGLLIAGFSLFLVGGVLGLIAGTGLTGLGAAVIWGGFLEKV